MRIFILKSLNSLFLLSSFDKHNRRTVHTITETEPAQILDVKGKGKIPVVESPNIISNSQNASSSLPTSQNLEGNLSIPTAEQLNARMANTAERLAKLRNEVMHEVLEVPVEKTRTETETASSSFSMDEKDAVSSVRPIVLPLGDTKEIVQELDLIVEQTKKLKLGLQGLHVSVEQTLKERQIELPKTEAATKRAQSILTRAEHFLQSIENPGRTAFYCASALAVGYSLYNIVRYGELPFASLIRGGASRNLPTSISSNVAPIVSPICNPVINISYPSPQQFPVATNALNEFMGSTGVTTAVICAALLGALYIVRKVK